MLPGVAPVVERVPMVVPAGRFSLSEEFERARVNGEVTSALRVNFSAG